MASFTVEIDDVAAKAMLANLANKPNELKPLLATIGAELLLSTRSRFDDSKGPHNERWDDPISKAYKAYKAAHSGGDKPNIFSKIMRDTITTDVGSDELTIGSNVEYARRRQLGGSPAKDPARPFLGISSEDDKFINDAVADFLARN